MIRRAAIVLAVALLGLVFANLAVHHTERQSLLPLAKRYVELVPRDLGAANVITGILLTYRAFDTLGEVAVLFMVAAGVGLVLSARGRRNESSPGKVPEPPRPASEIVRTGAQMLVPLIAIFAAYIIMNGHLSAGGGFQGGAVIASSVLLLLLADPHRRLDLDFFSYAESVAGVLFVLVGIAGMIVAGGFLDNRVLPLGQFGAFFSAGAIPVLSILLGIKVGCELSVIIDGFRPELSTDGGSQ
jgi:multicomponent Na+:H+ antiporter subunit B